MCIGMYVYDYSDSDGLYEAGSPSTRKSTIQESTTGNKGPRIGWRYDARNRVQDVGMAELADGRRVGKMASSRFALDSAAGPRT